MRPTSKLLSLVVVATVAATAVPQARAEGELYRTPDDGASAEYSLHLEITDDGQTETRDATIILSSVGRTQENGVDCRWIEAWADIEAEGEVWKALVPEQYLTGDQNAAAYVRRLWYRRGSSEPEQLTPTDPQFQGRLGPIGLFLAGPLDDVQQLEPQEIEVPGLGTLVCEHESGTMTLPVGPNVEFTLDVEIWRSDEAPFGSVRILADAQRPESEQAFHVQLDLTAVGEDAQSRLPDAN